MSHPAAGSSEGEVRIQGKDKRMKKLLIGIMFAVAAGATIPSVAAGAAFTY